MPQVTVLVPRKVEISEYLDRYVRWLVDEYPFMDDSEGWTGEYPAEEVAKVLRGDAGDGRVPPGFGEEDRGRLLEEVAGLARQYGAFVLKLPAHAKAPEVQ